MGVWDDYLSEYNARGGTLRNTLLTREQNFLTRRSPDSLSYKTVSIIDTTLLTSGLNRTMTSPEIKSQNVSIISSDDLNIKTIISMPGESLRHGDIVLFKNQYWLITEKDYDNEVYTKCNMQQCNYLLRWVDTSGNLYEEWCVVNDGTKYMSGEYEDRDFVITRGDSRIQIILPRNSVTRNLDRTYRFLIGDPSSTVMTSYTLTKPLKVGTTFGSNDGVFAFVLQESDTEDTDNFDLRIADYYKFFTKPTATQPTESEIEPTTNTTSTGRSSWL